MNDVLELEQALRAVVRGEVSLSPLARAVYATDASIYEEQPVGVVCPRDAADVRAVLDVAARFGVSVLARGGGTSLAGQTTGHSLVVDVSRHMCRILEVNLEARWARVEPGVVLDDLNATLRPHRLHFAPDPATSNRATIGGMLANNSSGTRSVRYGKTVDHVRSVRTLLADGTDASFGALDDTAFAEVVSGGGRVGELHRDLRALVDANRSLIEERFPKIMRRVSGYHLDELVREWNVAKVVTGSEGTLALVTEATLNLVPLPDARGLALVHFNDLIEAITAVKTILDFDPSAVELLDGVFLGLARDHPTMAAEASFVQGDPKAILIVEVDGASTAEVDAQLTRLADGLKTAGIGGACPWTSDVNQQRGVWTLRKNGLSVMQSLKGDRKPIPFIEDAAVPVEHLPGYIEYVLALCRRLGVDVAMYAHASVGVIHVRPILDLKQQADIERMKIISEEAMTRVRELGGSWSGEHGDGRVRSAHLEAFFGAEVMDLFRRVKTLFDPEDRLNPGKIVNAAPIDASLRYGPDYDAVSPDTRYLYRDEGSFVDMVEMCSGVGACRKTGTGTMCPSYIATRDEAHSTRGRANVLRLAMNGRLGPAEGLDGAAVREALDLCLACKACKTECPNGVDMSKLKSEVLHLRHAPRGITARDKMVGGAPDLAALASGWPAGTVNRVLASSLGRSVLGRLGFASQRRPPAYAPESFTHWFARRGAGFKGIRRVALFVDTYMNHHEPAIGIAAVHALEACDIEVMIADVGCCQRPRLSKGLLDDAMRRGRETLAGLREFVDHQVPVVVCEPSCASALIDDLPDLCDDVSLADAVRNGVQPIEQYLSGVFRSGGRMGLMPRNGVSTVHVHGHCHQKALFGTESLRDVLSRAGLSVHDLDTGCCGMAGSFGYEREHYELSMKIGEDRLFPAVREISRTDGVVACGFSCRHQIHDALGRKTSHWVEFVKPID